jgi:hypothetical protein
MRILILVTITTLMLASLAPAFAQEESSIAAVVPEVVEQVLQEPLEVASDQSFEVKAAPFASAPVEYTVEAYEVQPAEAASLQSAIITTVRPTICKPVVYTTASSTLEGGYCPPTPLGAIPPPVPEPSSILALAAGLGGLIVRPFKRKK